MPTQKLTTEILNAAIEGLEAQKSRIEANISEIRQMLRGSTKPAAATPAASPAASSAAKSSKRTMSAAGRAAIAAAQRKRWAAKKKAAK
jgi:hypothetical protein